MFILEMELTDEGVTNYKKVLALIFEYMNIVCNQWLAKNQSIDLFDEIKLVSDLSFDCFDMIPDPETHVCALSEALIYCNDLS